MNSAGTYTLICLAALAVLGTLDSALGLGGGALIADICRTILDEGPGEGMAGMDMEIKPVPLIALSLCATMAAIWAVQQENLRRLAGRAPPSDAERAAILGAMLIVATAQGRTSRQEIADVFRIVTSHELEDELLDLSSDRFRVLSRNPIQDVRLAPVETAIGRRRTLAASMMVGCVARPADDQVTQRIETIAMDIGASSEDVAAARAALEGWQRDVTPTEGVSPVALLRHRFLELSPG